jgi:site-specific DNA recombinase
MLAETTMRLAFLGRTSAEDVQDPSISIPRQLRKCVDETTPKGFAIVAHYWDVESGRMDLDTRGISGDDWSRLNVPVPRDGGIQDMLRAAARGEFDGVIVESIDRVSRMTVDSTQIERDLKRLGVSLYAADEPMTTDATAILTRRVKQGISEWYALDLMEKSRRGMEESVRQGWHTGGRPPYGYVLEQHQHPNPSKAREGKHKHRLIFDPIRRKVVLMIYEDYCIRLIGLGEICDKLNRNPDRYPPPIPNAKDENELRHTWSRSVVQAILRNPKYTGYNVWGRHDKSPGTPLIRPRDQWVWSPEPTHSAIVSRELFDMVEERAQKNTNAMKAGMPRRAHKQTKPSARRVYPLRGRVRCSMCGRSMEGSHQREANWYRCQYVYRRGPEAATLANHPKVHGIKQDRVLEPVLDFLARRVFGPDRLRLLRDGLADASSSGWEDHTAELERLDAELAKLNRSLRAQTLRLEEHEDPNHPIVALASKRIVELSTRKAAVTDAIQRLTTERPAGHHPDEIVAMLDAVPDLRPTIATATDGELQEVFRAFDVSILYDKDRQMLTLAATITPELVPDLAYENDRPEGRSQINEVAGAGFEPATFGL